MHDFYFLFRHTCTIYGLNFQYYFVFSKIMKLYRKFLIKMKNTQFIDSDINNPLQNLQNNNNNNENQLQEQPPIQPPSLLVFFLP